MKNYQIWHNGRLYVLSNQNSLDIIEDGAIVVENQSIKWVGPTYNIPNEFEKQAQKKTDMLGACVTPGFIDCHTHCIYGGNRVQEFVLRLEGTSYEDILRQGGGILSTVRATRQANVDELYHNAKKRTDEFKRNGVTSFEVKSGYGLNLETEAKMLKVAQRFAQEGWTVQKTFLGAHVKPQEYASNVDYIHELVEHFLPALLQEELVDAVDAFCDTIAFSTKELIPLFEWAKKHQLKIKLHTEQLSLSGGAELAAEYNALSADHLEYLDVNGAKALAAADTVAVLLPGAYYFLRETQVPNVEILREHNIPMAIATDCNPGSSPCQSLLMIMNMACVLFKLTPFEVLKAVTTHAAKALGWASHKGQLQSGFDADFVIWDCEQIEEIMYNFGQNPCLKTIQKGKIIYDRS